MSDAVQKNYVWTYKKTINKYNQTLSTSSVGEIIRRLEQYGDKLGPLEFEILKMRLEGHSLGSIGVKFNLTRERIREREGYALDQLRFYSFIKNYNKDQIMNMNIPEFVSLIPPQKDYNHNALKNILLKNFKNHKVSYLVDNFKELISCRGMGNNCYEALRNLLGSYNIDMPQVLVFNSLKYKRRKRVR
ncbi:MAG: sigma factor-like helix-turn-helix DNA-binding protein [Candidatus Nanoarchaeia archaeon]